MNENETNQIYLTDKQALWFYLLILPFITITAFLNWTVLLIYMALVFIIAIGLTLLGK
jgi:hypothetical protein